MQTFVVLLCHQVFGFSIFHVCMHSFGKLPNCIHAFIHSKTPKSKEWLEIQLGEMALNLYCYII